MSYTKKIATCIKSKKDLTEWEKKFVEDYDEKIKKYGETTNFSEKQKAVIDKIIEKLSGDKPKSKAKPKSEPVVDDAGIFGYVAEESTELTDETSPI